MTDARTPSNTDPGNLAGALNAWLAALRSGQARLRRYADETGSSGPRYMGRAWDGALDALAAELPDVPALAAFAPAMDEADRVLAAHERVLAASVVVLNHRVRTAVAVGFSRTYSDSIGLLAKDARAALQAIEARRSSALRAAELDPGVGSTTVAEMRDAYLGGPRGAIATELYVSALLRLGTPEATALLHQAKNVSLGCADARRDYAHLHPAQAMGYIPRFRRVPATDAPAVQLDFAGAALSIDYEMERLTSRQRALEFGPLAPAESGIAYKLVERLRTVSGVAAPSSATPPPVSAAARPATADGPVAVSAGGSRYEIESAGTAQEWLPFSGPASRVQAYHRLCEAAIAPHVSDATELVEQFEAAAEDPPVEVPEVVAAALAKAFAKKADLADLTAEAYKAQVLGESDYLLHAAQALLERHVEKYLLSVMVRVEPRVQGVVRIAEREAKIDAAIRAVDLAKDLRKRLRDAYRAPPEPLADRESALRHYDKVAARASGGEPLDCSLPRSLKTYLMAL